MISKCESKQCKSKFQDEKYGKQLRVFTENKLGIAKCTVCGTAHSSYKKVGTR